MNVHRLPHRTTPLAELPLREHRALVDAGYAPLAGYIARLERVECGGCAPPVFVEPLSTEQRQDEPAPEPRSLRHRVMLGLAASVLAWAVLIFAIIGVVAVFGSRA